MSPEESTEPQMTEPKVSRRGLRFASLAGATIAVVIVVAGVTSRKMADAKLSQWTEDQAVPVVAVATPDTRSRVTAIDLPGRLEAYWQAQLFARASGFIKERKAD